MARQTKLFPEAETADSRLKEFLETFGEEKTMASDDREERALETVANALQGLRNDITEIVGGGKPRRGRRRELDDDDREMSVRDMRDEGRRGEAEGVAFEVKVPVGRNGGTLKGMLFFPGVRIRDDRDLEDLANEVERKFRSANVFTKDFNRGGYGGGNGYGGNGWRGRDDYYRGNRYRRD